jgi:hypothetical protein
MRKKVLKVVHDDDLVKLLEKLQLLEVIKAGRKKCKFCGKVVTLQNLQALFRDSGEINIVCDSIECLRKLNHFLEKTKQ